MNYFKKVIIEGMICRKSRRLTGNKDQIRDQEEAGWNYEFSEAPESLLTPPLRRSKIPLIRKEQIIFHFFSLPFADVVVRESTAAAVILMTEMRIGQLLWNEQLWGCILVVNVRIPREVKPRYCSSMIRYYWWH